VKELVEEAQIYANYAGRQRVKRSDIAFAKAGGRRNAKGYVPMARKRQAQPAGLMHRRRLRAMAAIAVR
jgi:hypothetical protein